MKNTLIVSLVITLACASCDSSTQETKTYMEMDSNPKGDFVQLYTKAEGKVILEEIPLQIKDPNAQMTLMDVSPSKEYGRVEYKNSDKPIRFPEELKPQKTKREE